MRIILSFLLLFTIIGCSEKVTSTYNLSNPKLTKETKDSIFVEVDNSNSILQLTGTINLIEGQCEVILYDPHIDSLNDGSTERRIVYNQIYKAPTRVKIDQQFAPSSGEHTLFYSVKRFNDIAPDGNLKLELINQY